MRVKIFILIYITALIVSPTMIAKDKAKGIRFWTERSVNLGKYDLSKSPTSTPVVVEQFYPLGFAKDGWFAYTHELNGDIIDTTEPPKAGGISLLNIQCEETPPCLSDSPSNKNDKCYCPISTTVNDLAHYHISPLKNPLFGSFPTKLLDDEYDLQIDFKEKRIPSEILAKGSAVVPEFPGTEIYLISQKMGKQLVEVIEHNHTGILPKSVQVAGWIKSPFEH
ncbi:MAG: hypothetical protein AB1489_33415, partial [Acidobacteriota bacterium]